MFQPSSSKDDYNTAAIRELLLTSFSDEDFENFCFDHFKKVYRRFSTGMTFPAKVQLLLDYCDRYSEFDRLLSLMKKYNPTKFAQLQSVLRTKNAGIHPDIVKEERPRLSMEERKTLQRQLENYEENLRLIEERISEFVEATDVPLTLLRNKKRIQEKIETLRTQLNLK